jgi:predicted tellurium resistance membrane protein TerC
MAMYTTMVRTMAILMIVIGIALILRTLPHFGVGIVLGALFLAAGVGRLVMLRRRR